MELEDNILKTIVTCKLIEYNKSIMKLLHYCSKYKLKVDKIRKPEKECCILIADKFYKMSFELK